LLGTTQDISPGFIEDFTTGLALLVGEVVYVAEVEFDVRWQMLRLDSCKVGLQYSSVSASRCAYENSFRYF
jgi:hypothetical protein